MAERDLIDSYVSCLNGSLKWRRDYRDVLDEVEDHLRASAENLVRSGAEPVLAQQTTLQRFGDPKVVALSYATTTSGGVAVPTQQTRAAGTVALISAGLWVLAAIVLAASRLQETSMYLIWAVTVLVAVATFAFVLAGVFLRTGGLRGLWPGVTLAVVALGFALSFIGTWAWPVWGIFLAVGALLTVLRLRSASLGFKTTTRATDWLLVAAWPIGVGMLMLLSELHVGPVDEYGDYSASQAVGFAIGAVLLAASLAQLGRWLRSEQPADIREGVAA